jgi:preprotein translocase subunit SecY
MWLGEQITERGDRATGSSLIIMSGHHRVISQAQVYDTYLLFDNGQLTTFQA